MKIKKYFFSDCKQCSFISNKMLFSKVLCRQLYLIWENNGLLESIKLAQPRCSHYTEICHWNGILLSITAINATTRSHKISLFDENHPLRNICWCDSREDRMNTREYRTELSDNVFEYSHYLNLMLRQLRFND